MLFEKTLLPLRSFNSHMILQTPAVRLCRGAFIRRG